MSRTYDWQGWLNAQQQNSGHDYDFYLQNALFTNALHGNREIWTPDLTPRPYTTAWQGLDSEEAFEKHLLDSHTRSQLEQWGWIDRKIEYRVNSWGFRSEREFDTVTGPSLIAMGCSFTFGTALPVESIWPTLASKRLGLELINLGVPGHGLDLNTQWLISQGHVINDPKVIVILMPPAGRITWVEQINGRIVGNTFSMTHLENTKIIDNVLLNAHMSYVRNINTIELWARSRNIPVYVFAGFNGHPIEFGLGRDLRHNGEPWHLLGADQICERIQNT
jgi:hypothetical protein